MNICISLDASIKSIEKKSNALQVELFLSWREVGSGFKPAFGQSQTSEPHSESMLLAHLHVISCNHIKHLVSFTG